MQTVKEIREYLQKLKESGKILPGDINPYTTVEAAIMLAFLQLPGELKPTDHCGDYTISYVNSRSVVAHDPPPEDMSMEGGVPRSP